MDDFQQELIKIAEKQDGRPFSWENVALVKECLHWNGAKVKLLTDDQYVTAYLLCNGFGDIDREIANDQAFDWSHVRDSTPIAIDRAAEYLKSLGIE